MGHVKDRWYSGKGDTKKPTSRHGSGLRWQIWYRVDGREKCGGSFRTKALAERKLVELEASVHRGAWVDPTDRTTVSEYAARWAASRPHGPRTATRVDSLIRNHIDATPLGARRLAAVLPSEAQAWASDRATVLAPSTLRKLVSVAGSIYNAAVLDRLVGASPMVGLTLPAASKERVVPLTVAQVRALAAATPERFRAMVFVQAGLGLRIGELLALRVQDIDFLRRTVRVEHQVAPKTLELIPPKTPQSRRTLPLPTMVSEALAGQVQRCEPNAEGLLWYTSSGRPIDHDYYGGRVFPKAVRAAQLPAGTTTHDLRHHYASVLLAAGESVIAVAERLGHENASLVLSTYAHLMPDSEDRTRKAIDSAWSDSGESPTAQGRPG